jgi:hypothetical protein
MAYQHSPPNSGNDRPRAKAKSVPGPWVPVQVPGVVTLQDVPSLAVPQFGSDAAKAKQMQMPVSPPPPVQGRLGLAPVPKQMPVLHPPPLRLDLARLGEARRQGVPSPKTPLGILSAPFVPIPKTPPGLLRRPEIEIEIPVSQSGSAGPQTPSNLDVPRTPQGRPPRTPQGRPPSTDDEGLDIVPFTPIRHTQQPAFWRTLYNRPDDASAAGSSSWVRLLAGTTPYRPMGPQTLPLGFTSSYDEPQIVPDWSPSGDPNAYEQQHSATCPDLSPSDDNDEPMSMRWPSTPSLWKAYAGRTRASDTDTSSLGSSL